MPDMNGTALMAVPIFENSNEIYESFIPPLKLIEAAVGGAGGKACA